MNEELALLQSRMVTIAEEALCAINNDSEHRVYGSQGGTYIMLDEIPPDRSVILQRESDGKKFRVRWTVSVTEEES